MEKDRVNGSFIRNKDATLKLWRIRASRLRSFTDREYARLQTFPDSWFFHGSNKRHIHKQIGNAVPIQFALRIGKFLKTINSAQVSGKAMATSGKGRNNQFEFKL
jgi:DNA (cytosine-5)-methyltransferase 1